MIQRSLSIAKDIGIFVNYKGELIPWEINEFGAIDRTENIVDLMQKSRNLFEKANQKR